MSQSNLVKKKRCITRTFLVYGEGKCEEVFLKHLRSIYSHNKDTWVKIEPGNGGTPRDIVVGATKTPGSYGRIFVVLDNDKDKREMILAREAADNMGVVLIENNPCLEFVLLAILGDRIPKGMKSKWYKKEFESRYINRKKRVELWEYRIFTKTLLDNKRNTISELNKMITLMEGDVD